MALLGAIEAGGTKFVCAVGTGPLDLRAMTRIPTTTPGATLGAVVDWFAAQQASQGALAAIGIGSFGPVDPRPQSDQFGYLLNTPKPHWSQVDLVGTLEQHFSVPIGFDTDVNAAALGEHRWGHGQGLDTLLYLTVGTGIGGGAVVNGDLLHGRLHPEMGHLLLPQDPIADPFPGCCPFHGNCLEGLASGVAIAQRWGQPADTLPPDHPAWALQADYLASALMTFTLVLSPQRILLGGGVMAQSALFPAIRQRLQAKLQGYGAIPQLLATEAGYIMPPKLGDRAGIIGALALAAQALARHG
ncbi:MAG: ROK family protein [Cyanobacteria bacterium]|nr:ROK family protein [Cyanobacteriota bacterium]